MSTVRNKTGSLLNSFTDFEFQPSDIDFKKY